MATRDRAAKCALVVALAVSLSSATIASAGPAGGAAGSSAKGGAKNTQSLKALKSLQALEPRALRLFPESFGGLWLDGRKVFTAFTERAKDRVGRLGKRFPGSKRLRAVTVDDSLASLRQLQAQMVADQTANPVMATDPPSGRPAALSYDLDIDVKRNVVVVIVERPVTPDLVAAFAQRYGPDVVVEQGLLARPEGLFVCHTRDNCPPNLRSGLFSDDPYAYCSTAFTVTYKSGSKSVGGVLSAAHCGSATGADYLADRFHVMTQYGEVVAEQQSGKVDAELHSVNGAVSPDTIWGGKAPWIYVTDAMKKGVVTKVGTYNGLPVGYSLCKSGYVTGRTCGQVLTKFYAPGTYVQNGMDFVKASYCSNPGDSGSGVYHQIRSAVAAGASGSYEALGVHSGGPSDPRTEMSLICPDPNDFGIFGHIEFVESAFALTVNKGAP